MELWKTNRVLTNSPGIPMPPTDNDNTLDNASIIVNNTEVDVPAVDKAHTALATSATRHDRSDDMGEANMDLSFTDYATATAAMIVERVASPFDASADREDAKPKAQLGYNASNLLNLKRLNQITNWIPERDNVPPVAELRHPKPRYARPGWLDHRYTDEEAKVLMPSWSNLAYTKFPDIPNCDTIPGILPYFDFALAGLDEPLEEADGQRMLTEISWIPWSDLGPAYRPPPAPKPCTFNPWYDEVDEEAASRASSDQLPPSHPLPTRSSPRPPFARNTHATINLCPPPPIRRSKAAVRTAHADKHASKRDSYEGKPGIRGHRAPSSMEKHSKATKASSLGLASGGPKARRGRECPVPVGRGEGFAWEVKQEAESSPEGREAQG
ncbi:hypothetical protein OE88DRAFT_1647975 [Heliocybe sulcata]|uniref:Uncharacterized protein n=1 Tax=Heliocybe sulcata TaxID=5364 RepID=A0A5C3MP51_9AGAM|nr:hypothetical protein OE88DRAFT_1647975 [Heliocybe sulcata]